MPMVSFQEQKLGGKQSDSNEFHEVAMDPVFLQVSALLSLKSDCHPNCPIWLTECQSSTTFFKRDFREVFTYNKMKC